MPAMLPSPTTGDRAMKPRKPESETATFAALVVRALRRSAKKARQIARMHDTPVWIWKDGEVVAERP